MVVHYSSNKKLIHKILQIIIILEANMEAVMFLFLVEI